MKLQTLHPRRALYRCDRCGSTDNLAECFLPYRAGARTSTPGGGKFYDLCQGCREWLQRHPHPHPYAPEGDLPTNPSAACTPGTRNAQPGAAGRFAYLGRDR